MFTVRQGIPVEWQADGSQAQGCARVLTVPDLGLTASLPQQGSKTIVFVPKQAGNLRFSCPMALTTPDAMFMVVSTQSQSGVISSPRTLSQPLTGLTHDEGGSMRLAQRSLGTSLLTGAENRRQLTLL
jgi:plastocyanin domain-containing protein